MAQIVTLTDRDGKKFEFVKDDPKSGAIKDVYFSPDRSYVVAFFRKTPDENGRRRIEKIVGEYYDRIFNRIGGEYWRTTFCWPYAIVEYDEEVKSDDDNDATKTVHKVGVVMPTYGPEFFFRSGQEKECKWWGSAKNYNRFVEPDEKGTLRGFIHACLEVSRAIRRLHLAGLAHSDLSYKNCLVDPVSGRGCVIDVDGLVVPNLFHPDVLGTRDFMAPEVVATKDLPKEERVLPNSQTDLHSLAVLIYLCLLHRHPLRGSKIFDQEDDKEQEKMEMGEGALFIEHPTDASNRRVVAKNEEPGRPWVDPEQIPYTVCGPYLKKLFDRAFIKGLHSRLDRPAASEWEDALSKTLDLILPCSNPRCVKHEFVFDGQGKPVCPYCGTVYKESIPVLEYKSSRNGVDYRDEDRKLVGFDGKEIFQWHVDKNLAYNEKLTEAQKKRVGYLSKKDDEWYLHNEGIEKLFDMTNQRAVPVGEAVRLSDSLRLSLYDDSRSYIAQVRVMNKARRGGMGGAAMRISLDLAENDATKKHDRIDAALRAIQSLRLPNGTVGKPYSCKLSFKNFRDANGRNIGVSILEAQGFDEFGLVCTVQRDSVLFEGTPTREYDGKVDIYISGKFRSSFNFEGRTPIPGEFKFTNIRISKVLSIKVNTEMANAISREPEPVEETPSSVAPSTLPEPESSVAADETTLGDI